MALTAPPVIPLVTDPNTFSPRAQDWTVWQADSLYPFLADGASLIGLSTTTTSTTSNTVGTGSKTFTVEASKGFVNGMSLSIARTSAPTNRMFAVVTSYSGTSLQVTSQAFEGSGTFTDWSIAIAVNAVVTTAQIQDAAVTQAKIADSAISNFTKSKIQDVDATVAGNNLTITINPTVLDFRSTTLTDGTPTTVTLSSAITVVVPSGGTLGTTNAVAARLAILAINNAGTIEAAVINLSGGNQLDETNLITTTTVGTGSDSNNVAYSTTGRTSVAYRVLGFIGITEATAGTWATAPTLVQGAGGQALSSFQSITTRTAIATTSGTSQDFIEIPANVKRITLMLNGVSTSGTSPVLIQLGSTTFQTSGYLGASSVVSSAVNSAQFSTGFIINFSTESAAGIRHGAITFVNISGNIWNAYGNIARSDSALTSIVAGLVSLSGVLDRVRLTTVNGTDTFDAGSINLLLG